MAKDILWIGGSKGGVGKSLLTMAVVDLLQVQGERVLLIESDTGNPDVWKTYQGCTQTLLLDLDQADGWIDLVNQCESHPESTVVINTAARSNGAVAAFGHTLHNSLAELQRTLVTLWIINRQRDSLELLKEYRQVMAGTTLHVVRNGYFGEEHKFELYNASKLRQEIEAEGGHSFTLPDLADRVSDDLYSKRLTLAAAAKELPLGNRAELTRWRQEVKKALAVLIP